MNPTITRLLKEARLLFWPWCVVACVGGLPLVQQQWLGGWRGMIGRTNAIEALTFLAFFGGIPLLATISLGAEFQYATLPLLLGQPMGRMRIWREKMSVTALALASVALVFNYSWHHHPSPQSVIFRSALAQAVELGLVAVIGSAVYWTLMARSTMGGLILNICVQYVVFGGVTLLAEGILGRLLSTADIRMAVSIGALPVLCYAGVMFWLGARKFQRFQATGGVAGNDLIADGPRFLPEALARLLRARPSGAFRNLIRKELQMQRPIWPLTLLLGCGWLALTIPGGVPVSGQVQEPSTIVSVAMVLLECLSLVIAVLAGCLSLGEERTSGTHIYQLTLPMSVRRQWLIKLAMAISTALLCAAAVPVSVMMVVGWVRGTAFTVEDAMLRFGTMFLFTLAAFWCACAVNGTWPAVAWVFPAMAAVDLARRCGLLLAGQLTLNAPTLREFAISRLHLDPEVLIGAPSIIAAEFLLIAPATVLAVVQSYRMFRTQPQDSTFGIGRSLLALALVVLSCTLLVNASGIGGQASSGMYRTRSWYPLREIEWAAEKRGFARANSDAHPRQVTVADLAETSLLSPLTQRWLRGSRITIVPNQAFVSDPPAILIHLVSGLECRIGVIRLGHRPDPIYWPPSSGCTQP
jgi:hypothetical protein